MNYIVKTYTIAINKLYNSVFMIGRGIKEEEMCLKMKALFVSG